VLADGTSPGTASASLGELAGGAPLGFGGVRRRLGLQHRFDLCRRMIGRRVVAREPLLQLAEIVRVDVRVRHPRVRREKAAPPGEEELGESEAIEGDPRGIEPEHTSMRRPLEPRPMNPHAAELDHGPSYATPCAGAIGPRRSWSSTRRREQTLPLAMEYVAAEDAGFIGREPASHCSHRQDDA
jgi:hypothetical protein